MSLLPYALLRPFLFRLDAEAAHELTLAQLERIQHTPLLALAAQPRIDDPLTLAGLRFPNRVGLAAGLDKNARCIDAWGALGFGFVEVGTVTPLAQAGNPKPRIFRLPQSRALINRLGFNNEGLAAFVANVRRSRLRAQRPTTPDSAAPALVLGLNIGKNAATPIERASDDYLAALEAVYPHADYVAVNISSPNTQNLRALQSDAALEQLLAALAERRAELSAASGVYRPLFIKIAPDLEAEQIEAIAAALLRHGMDGVIATNTTLGRSAVQGQPHADEAGGLSGAPLLQASNAVVRALRQRLGPDFPIIGVGGVQSGADAQSKLQAGADLVQLYTGLIYRGPALVPEVARALASLQRPAPAR
ncbi:dihydroorotate dehydrogenase [Serpentinimonas raichei]|uniref:Dihydroorotate dehydrogenase (quinone) n=1 Tax=Serpentinimonas raichei TaxID=1458425 RepID=A0A060NI42_9BURK|nr:quinone-dependent dihydroorotate dehydrogenase [Serpentinimonas raichei]BAO80540.1 dihydroorotate dehydrogenase [Serpentinimonas raichei]